MKKKNSNFLFKLSVITLSVLCLTSCSEEEQLIGKWIGIFVGVVAAMLILNMILEYLAIKLAYIYWPACLIASIIIFYSEMRGGLAGDLKGMILAHFILLYFLIPNCDDNVEHYVKIQYEYDFTWNEWNETSRKSFTEETPGFVVKLVCIGLVGFAAIGIPLIFNNYHLFWIGFGIEGLWSLYFSYCGIKRLIKYHS